MAEMVVSAGYLSAGTGAAQTVARAKAIQRVQAGDTIFRLLTFSSAALVLALLGGLIVSLMIGAAPAFQAFGWRFLIDQSWNPVTERFGAIAPIYGTIVTSVIAMLIAVPVGLAIAMFLSELCPMWLRRPLGIAIELLAGIPSIIYVICGLFVLAPILQTTVQPALLDFFRPLPVLSALFSVPTYGIGTLTAR